MRNRGRRELEICFTGYSLFRTLIPATTVHGARNQQDYMYMAYTRVTHGTFARRYLWHKALGLFLGSNFAECRNRADFWSFFFLFFFFLDGCPHSVPFFFFSILSFHSSFILSTLFSCSVTISCHGCGCRCSNDGSACNQDTCRRGTDSGGNMVDEIEAL